MLYLTACGLAFLAAAVLLALRGEREPAILAALMVPAWTIAAGLAGHQWVTVAIGTAVLAVMLTRWGGLGALSRRCEPARRSSAPGRLEPWAYRGDRNALAINCW